MLQGSLDTVSLDEVLAFLSSSSKTGVLRLSGDRGTGSVWVQDGQMVSAEATYGGNELALEEVIFELLRFSSGTFSFDFDEISTSPGAPMAVEGVLAQANKLLVEWRGIELVVPGLDYRVAPAPSLPADQVTITKDEWATLLAVGPNASVEEVNSCLRLGELEGLRRLKGLIERKLILLSEPPVASLASETAMSVEPEPVIDTSHAPTSAESPAPEVIDEPEATIAQEAPAVGSAVDDGPDVEVAPSETPVAPPAREMARAAQAVPDSLAGKEPVTTFDDPASDPETLNVPPPIAPSARRLSAKRASLPKSDPIEKPAMAREVEAESALPAPPPAMPETPLVEESVSDAYAGEDVRPPMPPPPPMPSAPSGMAPLTGAEVPPPPAPPSPAEIAKFGNSVDDASSISDESAEKESSLLMRYLQSES
jgi:hypothetical protein